MPRPTTKNISQMTKINQRQLLEIKTRSAANVGHAFDRLTLFAAGLLEKHKMAEDGISFETDYHGNPLMEKDEMSPAEVRACEIILKKYWPDQAAITVTEEDELESLTRTEMENRLRDMAEKNPQLALVAGLDTVLNTAKTILTVEKDNGEDK